jgi:hypothetical protein
LTPLPGGSIYSYIDAVAHFGNGGRGKHQQYHE